MKRALSAISIYVALFSTYSASETINNNQEKTVNTTWDIASSRPDTLIVGDKTSGKLTITEGGDVTTRLFSIARNGASGLVEVINGGKLTINNNSYAYPFAIGGSGGTGSASAGGVGTLNISGAGSEVTINNGNMGGDIAVGSQGATGYLNITEGGKLTANSVIYIGSRGTGSEGHLTIDGPGSELHTQRAIIGVWENLGTAVISNGGTLKTDTTLSVGNEASAKEDNLLVVTGAGSLAQSGTTTSVGLSGKGTAIISDSGTLSASKIIIASKLGSTGELAIGSRKGEQATKAGIIDAPEINFGKGNGTLVFNHTNNDFNLSSNITGTGTVEAFSGTTILSGTNTYTGNTIISNATLQAGANNIFSANSDYHLTTDGIMRLDGFDQTIKSLDNAGVVDLTGANAGTKLTVSGDYVGNNGFLILGAALEDDGSTTDQLVINGNATGTTNVAVKNLGGQGAQTVEGIKLIKVDGTSTDNAFKQNGRIVAGAYDYSLIKGTATGQDDQSWYLTSKFNPTESALRPEAGSYLANLTAANTMFNLRLHDRQSDTQYINPITNEKQTTSLWLRHSYGHNEFNDNTGQLATKSDRNIVQAGADLIQASSNGKDGIHVGVMAGYGDVDSKTRSKITKNSASSNIKGYNAGIYGTWYADETNKNGLYVDSWVQWNQLEAKVNGKGLAQEKYDLKGVTSSIETGYSAKVTDVPKDYELRIQPQAQATWMDVKADNHKENNGTNINASHGNIQTRVGSKLMLAKKPQNNGSKLAVNPYIETNWIHNSKTQHISMDSAKVKQNGSKDVGEIKLGVEGNITNNTNLWLNVGQQFGHDGYKDTATVVGIKYKF